MRPDKKPKMLYRKVNTRARGVFHHKGGDYRHERNTKAERQAVADGVTRAGMHLKAGTKKHRGLDYTPLHRFLLSKVGQPWEPVEKEARARLDHPDPIYWIVDLAPDADAPPVVRCGESTYYSRLTVDAAGILVKLDPTVRRDQLWPTCGCCTHTFNGEPFVNPWVWGAYDVYYPDAPPVSPAG